MREDEVPFDVPHALQEVSVAIRLATDALFAHKSTMTNDEAIATSESLRSMKQEMDILVQEADGIVRDFMRNNDTKEMTLKMSDGTLRHLELRTAVKRTAVKRDELISDIERLAKTPLHRLDETTGELHDVAETAVRLLKSAFRFEPRWSYIAELGLSDDEYCQKAFDQTVNIKKDI